MPSPKSSTGFSNPSFNARAEAHRAREEASQEALLNDALDMEEDLQDFSESIENLVEISHEVAQAAKKTSGLETEDLYKLQQKGRVRRAMNNRGPHSVVEATQGWVLVPPSSDVIGKPPGKANLTDNSGMGLVLTEDGRLYPAVAWKGLLPWDDRLQTIERRKIGRNTFIPKETPPEGFLKAARYDMPEETAFPRYRAVDEKTVPTILGDPDNPNGGLDSKYFTPYVIEQCYNALARFVQRNNIRP